MLRSSRIAPTLLALTFTAIAGFSLPTTTSVNAVEASYQVSLGANVIADPNYLLSCSPHGYDNSVGCTDAVLAATEGVEALDSSLGGIGGCPFAPKATGNIPTEDLVWMLQRSGFKVNADLTELMTTSRWLESKLGRTLPSMVFRAGVFPPID